MNKKKLPPFSVLLSVYEKENPNYLNQALESIWDYQSLKPDQIVLVLDGPLTEDLYNAVNFWKDKLNETLTCVVLEKNVGLAAALNEGLKYCKNELVARMDTDDVAVSERFELQLNFMLSNPNIAVSSGRIDEYTDDLSTLVSKRELPLTHGQVVRFAKKRNPIS